MMNRRDFEALAEFAQYNLRDGYDANYLWRCRALAKVCQKRAPDFNEERFLAACDTPVCVHHKRRDCLSNVMGVIWCDIADEPGEPA